MSLYRGRIERSFHFGTSIVFAQFMSDQTTMNLFPSRPETSFNWFTNPWKVFTILIWRRYKWHLMIGLIIILLIIFIVLMAYTAPVSTDLFELWSKLLFNRLAFFWVWLLSDTKCNLISGGDQQENLGQLVTVEVDHGLKTQTSKDTDFIIWFPILCWHEVLTLLPCLIQYYVNARWMLLSKWWVMQVL